MHITDQDFRLLFIEPIEPPSATPVLDELTARMVVALHWTKKGILVRNRVVSGYYRDVHICSCGAAGSNQDHLLLVQKPARLTNLLAAHYLAWHREEIPASELAKVKQLKQPTFSFKLDHSEITSPERVTL